MSDSDMLPDGWAWIAVADLAAPQKGAVTDGPFGSNLKTAHYTQAGPRVVRLQNISEFNFVDERAHISEDRFEKLQKHEVLPGDVLVALLGDKLPRACTAPATLGPAIVKADCVRFRLDQRLALPRYAMYALNAESVRDQAKKRVHGVGRPRLRLKDLKALRLPVAPLPEQGRLVSSIESYMTRLDDAAASLERVRANLRRYRASVLKAAVDGQLVPAEVELARREGHDHEPASALLGRILAERRRRWEEAELARFKATDTHPKDDGWRNQYKKPIPPDTTDLPNLPGGWCWTSVDALVSNIEAGKNFRCIEQPPETEETGVVKVSAVSWGSYDEAESKTCKRADLVNESLLIREGDFLFSRANTVELVGACVIARNVRRRVMLSDKILRLSIIGNLDRWLLTCLRSRPGRRELERRATGNQHSMRNISQSSLRRIPIPLPPETEIERVLASCERHLSIAEDVGQAVDENAARVERLRQAALGWAFEGKLVAQDPNDEAVSVMLQRTKAERDMDEPRKKTRRDRKANAA